MPSGSERQKEKLCWNGRDSVPDEGGDDSDHEEKSEQGYYSNPPFQHFPCRVQNQEKICLERKVSSPARSFMMYHIRRFASLKTDLSAAFLTGVRLCLPRTRIDISCDAMGREVNFV